MRTSRIVSRTEIYHVMARGNGRQLIFIDELDHHYFLKLLREIKSEFGSELYAYCLMGNHYHLLIKETNLSEFCKRLNQTYAHYFNARKETVGHVFQGRYKSFPVEDEDYLLSVLRYIHNNPVKAKLCSDPKDYRWSSYNDYLDRPGFADAGPILKCFSSDADESRTRFIGFSGERDGFDYETNRAQELYRAYKDIEGEKKKTMEERPLNISDYKRLSGKLHQKDDFSEKEIAQILGVSKAKYYRKIEKKR